MKTARKLALPFSFPFLLRIGNLDMKTESNIIEYKYEANTKRNEYGDEY